MQMLLKDNFNGPRTISFNPILKQNLCNTCGWVGRGQSRRPITGFCSVDNGLVISSNRRGFCLAFHCLLIL